MSSLSTIQPKKEQVLKSNSSSQSIKSKKRNLPLLDHIRRSEWVCATELLKDSPHQAQFKDRAGILPLHWVFHDNLAPFPLVQKLVSAYKDGVKTRTDMIFKRLPLHYAALRGASPEVIQLLLDHYPGAASTTDAKGDLPLHHACCNNESSVHVIKSLVDAFREGTIKKNARGELPIQIAFQRGLSEEAISILLSSCPDNILSSKFMAMKKKLQQEKHQNQLANEVNSKAPNDTKNEMKKVSEKNGWFDEKCSETDAELSFPLGDVFLNDEEDGEAFELLDFDDIEDPTSMSFMNCFETDDVDSQNTPGDDTAVRRNDNKTIAPPPINLPNDCEMKPLSSSITKSSHLFVNNVQTETEILASVDESIRNDFLKVGFCKWKKKEFLPVLQLGPYDAPPLVRDKWMGMCKDMKLKDRPILRLVFWYGTPKDDLSQGYSLMPSKSILSYKKGHEKGFHKIPTRIRKKAENGKKLSSTEQYIIDGLKEIERAQKLPPADRVVRLENGIVTVRRFIHENDCYLGSSGCGEKTDDSSINELPVMEEKNSRNPSCSKDVNNRKEMTFQSFKKSNIKTKDKGQGKGDVQNGKKAPKSELNKTDKHKDKLVRIPRKRKRKSSLDNIATKSSQQEIQEKKRSNVISVL